MSVAIYFRDESKTYYNTLFEKKQIIESEMGMLLDWQEKPKHISSSVTLEKEFNLNKQDEQQE